MTRIDESVVSTDIDQAEHLLRRVYPAASFRETTAPFIFQQRVQGDHRAALARFAIETWTEIEVDFSGTLGIGTLLAGDYTARSGDDPLDVGQPFLFRPSIGGSRSEGLDLLMVNLKLVDFARFAGAARGIENARLRVTATAPVDAQGAATWSRTVRFVQEVFEDPVGLGNDLLRNAAVEMLFASALSAFQIEVVGVPAVDEARGALPSAVRRALGYIDDHLTEPIAVEDMAAAARVSVRALQDAFRRDFDLSPIEVVRHARLSGARADLLAADFTASSVAQIAHRWGFQHLGRFASEYRAAFGELPRQTLRR
ncbi:AraC family transcriptional regulator [Herbiconiux sp. L3-i23]|uniref:AraC family transcriptional regulator n=1 Tax=Herbiconiux sp. L3-i23 TaxID=2905871 RepID=UPI0020507775|nr:AraC family transcriptional regulator [Herbiconiux sp. L3-i23]BDI21710.1 hypothetical protein L3i23_04860 [Herbiconiux sp. L3-i23]